MSIRLTPLPLRVEAAFRELESPLAGGVTVFLGRVRPDRSRSGRVVALFYEAHRRLALRSMRSLARAAVARYELRRVVLWHRLGIVAVGEVSVIVGVAAPHRADAFAAARFLIDRVKTETPIWKMDRVRRARRPRRRRVPRGERGAD
ncbi:MAG: molybdenum cofactor biosynthesis protein MoaE [Thermoplasmata archaeon]